MYVAVKGGQKAIAHAHALLAKEGRGALSVDRLSVDAVAGQLPVLVSRVMTEGSLYDPDLAARAIRQSQGDVIEAITLLRSYRTTLPRLGYTRPIDTARLTPQRRVSATFKDIPGGQQLGATFDYTHRLFDDPSDVLGDNLAENPQSMPRVTDLLGADALLEPDHPEVWDDPEPGDLTTEPGLFPMSRAGRLQALARGDEGFLLAMGYSTQRGFGNSHPFAGEIRVGEVEIEIDVPGVEHPVPVGRIEVTECQMINQFVGAPGAPPQFTRGYGLVFGRGERKAMSMALVDRALRAEEFDERVVAPAQDEEFVVSHADSVQAAGFVEHLKLPHYVDFQAESSLLRRLRSDPSNSKNSVGGAE
ncbi:carbon-phosphorus lyase complex subunit PhnI [Skermania sp. ID1734]|uniref:carbon-phosphorus lyase complex subunit PhnI n=1 Tax=Skermania sp. ID1734 TaxID=2597516 RepID=UPI000EB39C04|nr:carbon-phosphorus lyase complex subunit PhnI [Skermania sp. ID1734]TSD92930.1 carbon-phosphorus lyase complex subunit PhnI [Skermania sp. ID1734]